MKVAVLMGSPSDKDKMQPAADTLTRLGIEADVRVMSAHRTPKLVAEFASTARDNGYVAIICGAGWAAHLAGAVAANTTLPVVGVPLSGSALNGVDALYAHHAPSLHAPTRIEERSHSPFVADAPAPADEGTRPEARTPNPRHTDVSPDNNARLKQGARHEQHTPPAGFPRRNHHGGHQ